MVPMKTPNSTPSPDPITPDRAVRTAQLFIKSSDAICSAVGISSRRYLRCPGGSFFGSPGCCSWPLGGGAASLVEVASGTGLLSLADIYFCAPMQRDPTGARGAGATIAIVVSTSSARPINN
jgi:hypothetical protein